MIPVEAVDKLKLDITGVQGAEVYPLVVGRLAAIVSDIETEEGTLRPERKQLAAHSDVLRKVIDQAPLLPVAFGIVAGSEREVRELLSNQRANSSEQLGEVMGSWRWAFGAS